MELHNHNVWSYTSLFIVTLVSIRNVQNGFYKINTVHVLIHTSNVWNIICRSRCPNDISGMFVASLTSSSSHIMYFRIPIHYWSDLWSMCKYECSSLLYLYQESAASCRPEHLEACLVQQCQCQHPFPTTYVDLWRSTHNYPLWETI